MSSRLLARIIDGVLGGLILAFVAAAVCTILVAAGAGGIGVQGLVILIFGVLAVLTPLVYEIVFIGRWGATVGKRILNISVVDVETKAPIGVGRAFVRYLVLVVTGSIFFIGYLSPLFNSHQRGWHDIAGGDVVARGAAKGMPAGQPPTAAQRRSWIPAIAVGLVAYVVCTALFLVSFFALTHKPVSATPNAAERQQVLAAAKTCTSRILSYDYRTLDVSEKAGQACSTGQLKSDYTKLMDTTVKSIAPQNNVVQVFQVEKAGITRVSPDGKQWVIVVYGQQQVTSKTVTAGPRLDISNAVVTLNKVGGQWLVSNMTTTG